MGLLSRLGGGLKLAAAPGGPMSQMVSASLAHEEKKADRTYLAAAEEKKHNRLLKREEKAFERLTGAAETKWERDLDLLDRKEKQAIAAAKSEGQLEYFKGRLDDTKAVILKLEEKLSAYLTVGQFEQIDPEMRERKFKAFNAALERLRAAQETYNTLDAQYRSASGLPPSIGLETEDFDINAAVNMAAEEIVRSGEEEGATGLISVPTLTDQVKSINDMLERNKMSIMTPEQETSFRELVEAQVRGIGGQQMPSEVSTALGLEPGVSIYEQQKAASAAKEREGSVYDLDLALQKGGRDPTKYIEGTPSVTEEVISVDDEALAVPMDPADKFRVPSGETLAGRAIDWLREGLQEGISTQEPLPFFTTNKDPSLQKEIAKLSDEGQLFWTAFGEAVGEIGLDSAIDSLSEQFEALSNADKKIMYNLSRRSGKSIKKPFDPIGSSTDKILELIDNFSKPSRQ